MNNVVQWYENDEGERLPAIKILGCVFVMDRSEQIIHFHEEELGIKMVDSEQRYFLNGCVALEDRSRCQVIPPFINAFRDIKKIRSE